MKITVTSPEQTEISKMAAVCAPSTYISTPQAALTAASEMAALIRCRLSTEKKPNASMAPRQI